MMIRNNFNLRKATNEVPYIPKTLPHPLLKSDMEGFRQDLLGNSGF
jgi:hypothetical protein